LAEDRPDPKIYEFTVSNSRDKLLAYFSLKNGCPPYVQIALESGIIVRYIYEVELQAPRFLMEKRLSRLFILRTLRRLDIFFVRAASGKDVYIAGTGEDGRSSIVPAF
jgi:hypothetical protein